MLYVSMSVLSTECLYASLTGSLRFLPFFLYFGCFFLSPFFSMLNKVSSLFSAIKQFKMRNKKKKAVL